MLRQSLLLLLLTLALFSFFGKLLITHSVHGVQEGAVTHPPSHAHVLAPRWACSLSLAISIFHLFGLSDLYRAGHLAQVGPVNSRPGILLELLRKSLPLSIAFAKLVTRDHPEEGSFLRQRNKMEEGKAKRWSMTHFLTTSLEYPHLGVFMRYVHWTFLLY